MQHLSFPELVSAADHHERQSRILYRTARNRSGQQRRSCLVQAQQEARMARECRVWLGCEGA